MTTECFGSVYAECQDPRHNFGIQLSSITFMSKTSLHEVICLIGTSKLMLHMYVEVTKKLGQQWQARTIA